MGKQITLYCEETPGLKLGPGITSDFNIPNRDPAEETPVGNVIVFVDGFATFDDAAFPDWPTWIRSPGAPTIRIVDTEAGEATSAQGAVACPVCGRPFQSDFALNGHLRSHAPKGLTSSKTASA